MSRINLTTYDHSPILRTKGAFLTDRGNPLTAPMVVLADRVYHGRTVPVLLTRGFGNTNLPLVFSNRTPLQARASGIHTIGWSSLPSTGRPFSVQFQHDGRYYLLQEGARAMSVESANDISADLLSSGLFVTFASDYDSARFGAQDGGVSQWYNDINRQTTPAADKIALAKVRRLITEVNSFRLSKNDRHIPQELVGKYYALANILYGQLNKPVLAATVFAHLERLYLAKGEDYVDDAAVVRDHVSALLEASDSSYYRALAGQMHDIRAAQFVDEAAINVDDDLAEVSASVFVSGGGGEVVAQAK